MPAVKHRPVDSAPTRVRHRKSVEKLTAAQLRDLRRAIAAMAAIGDDRGYQYHASLHGGPPRAYCQHGQPEPFGGFRGASLFLPWHRAYLYHFELAMQDQVAEATLPWWDWTSPHSHTHGVPAAYATESVRGAPNALFRQPIIPGRPPDAGPPELTWRTPDDPAHLPTGADVEDILGLGQFRDFTSQLEGQLHNAVHGWVGGAMGQIPIAAYDPVFWAHHTMVDRLWALWQLRHGQPGPQPGQAGVVLAPFSMKVSDTYDINVLGYEYAGSTAHVGGTI